MTDRPERKRKRVDLGGVILVIVLGAGVIAVVVVNIRGWMLSRERKRDGWNIAEYMADANDSAHDWRSDAQLTGIIVDNAGSDGYARLGVSSHLKFEYAPGSPSTDRYCQLDEYIHDARVQLSSGMRPGDCGGGTLPPLRCSIPQIWQRAIAGGAPPHALARITLSGRRWELEVNGRPSNGAKTPLDQQFDDDCQPIVEH
jgi:hypothetical protein